MIENNNNQNNTDRKIQEITEKIEFFIKDNKKFIVIGGILLVFILFYLLFGGSKTYDKEKLKSKFVDIAFEVNKKESVDLLEGTVKIIKEGVTGKIKEYYEVINDQEITRIRERNCEGCVSVSNQEEEIGKFPINEALVEATKSAQNTLQYIKNGDPNSFIRFLSADGLANLDSDSYFNIIKKHGFKLNSFTIGECSGNLKQTNYMEVICRTDVNYEYLHTGQINEKLDLRVIYDKGSKSWGVVFPFTYKIFDGQRVSKKYYDAKKVNASVNTSLSIFEGTIVHFYKKLHDYNLFLGMFRTNQVFDYLVVENIIYYETKNKDNSGKEIIEEKNEKIGEYKVNVRRGVTDNFSQFNKKFDYVKDDRGVYSINAYIPMKKPFWTVKSKDELDGTNKRFIKYVQRITPGINTVNPYLKFPTIELEIDRHENLYDNYYVLGGNKKENK